MIQTVLGSEGSLPICLVGKLSSGQKEVSDLSGQWQLEPISPGVRFEEMTDPQSPSWTHGPGLLTASLPGASLLRAAASSPRSASGCYGDPHWERAARSDWPVSPVGSRSPPAFPGFSSSLWRAPGMEWWEEGRKEEKEPNLGPHHGSPHLPSHSREWRPPLSVLYEGHLECLHSSLEVRGRPRSPSSHQGRATPPPREPERSQRGSQERWPYYNQGAPRPKGTTTLCGSSSFSSK